MFEGRILQNHLAETLDGLPLRELAWADLVARLAAVRELRGELDQVSLAVGGGFSEFANIRKSADSKGKRDVNHSALARGKSDGASGGIDSAENAEQIDREN